MGICLGRQIIRGWNVAEIKGNMMLVNSGFQMWKDLFGNYPQYGHEPSKIFYSPVLGPKNLEIIVLEWRQIIIVLGSSIFL
jgi:hypothetical protein